MRYVYLMVMLLLLGLTYSYTSFDPVTNTAAAVCQSLRNLLPAVAMLMIIGAGVTYAIGQFVGAETRARANVWATNMLIGAIIGLVIAVVAPAALNTLMQNASSTTGSSNWC